MESGEAHSRYLRVDALTHPLAPIAERFWDARPGDGIVIGRDIPTRPIARLLSYIAIYQPIEGGTDFKVHLAGTAVRIRFAREITGAKLSELFAPEDFRVRFQAMMEVIDKNEPRRACITHTAGDVDVFRLELLMLPVWSPDRSTRWTAVFCFYF